MREMREILARAAVLRLRGESAVLATVVAVEGSAYRREGARMLLEQGGELTGVLSGGCLERDLAERAAAVLGTGEPALATYDLRAPDEILWGLGLGCGGKITILLEALPCGDGASPSEPLEPFERVARERNPIELETSFAGEVVLRERLAPPLRLVLAGAGRDALPLVRLACELGWETVVLDVRPTAAAAARFASFDDLARYAGVAPRDVETAVTFDPFTAAVVLTHNYLDDLAWLAALLPTVVPYVGLLGPATRRDRLLADLAMQGLTLDEPMRARLHGPAGLDIGGRAPEQVALSIAAEIQATMGGALLSTGTSALAPAHEKAATPTTSPLADRRP